MKCKSRKSLINLTILCFQFLFLIGLQADGTDCLFVVPDNTIQAKIDAITETSSPDEWSREFQNLRSLKKDHLAELIPQILYYQMNHKGNEQKLWGTVAILEKLWPEIGDADLAETLLPYLKTEKESLKKDLYEVLDEAFYKDKKYTFEAVKPLLKQHDKQAVEGLVDYMICRAPGEAFRTLASTLEPDKRKRRELLSAAQPICELLEARRSSVARAKPIEVDTVDCLEMLSHENSWWVQVFAVHAMERCRSFRRSDIISILEKAGDPLLCERLKKLKAVSEETSGPGIRKVAAQETQVIELKPQFESDKAAFDPESEPQIDEVVKMLKENPTLTARIEVHTDKNKKSLAVYSNKLTQQRAQAIVDYLSKSGIETNRLEAVGCGFSRPKVPNDPESGNPENKRIEIHIQEAP